MKRLAVFFSWGLMAVCCGIFLNNARADVFAPVPAGSVLYTQLSALQSAAWENDITGKTARLSKPGELTRYEFSIEIAKSAIDFNAHRQANPLWLNTVPRAELRALRALVLEFSTELAEFHVDAQRITSVIDDVLRSPATPAPSKQINLKSQTTTAHTLDLGAFPHSSTFNLTDSAESPVLNFSLSKQFALYAQLTTPSGALLHAAPQATPSTVASGVVAEGNTALSAGANMNINDWLSLRAGYAFNQNNLPQTLQQTLLARNTNSWFSALGATDSIGGGVDVKVSPGLTLSGGISRLSLNAANGLYDVSGTQLEGGVGVSGLNNRLLLSARLARLLPDDAASLASTAARLNLDLALSNNLSVNLLYQQMFSLSPQQDGKSTFAGGLNIHF